MPTERTVYVLLPFITESTARKTLDELGYRGNVGSSPALDAEYDRITREENERAAGS